MYLGNWTITGIVLFIVYLLWGHWTMYKQITVVRGCYLELGDWAYDAIQDVGGGSQESSRELKQEWEQLLRKHAVLMRRRGLSLRKSWSEYDVRFEKV
jgi:hypothetical protein